MLQVGDEVQWRRGGNQIARGILLPTLCISDRFAHVLRDSDGKPILVAWRRLKPVVKLAQRLRRKETADELQAW
jgi:hypothetical protein